MGRTGGLIVTALILALVAAGVLVWANVLDLSSLRGSAPSSSSPTGSPPAGSTDSGEQALMALVKEASGTGGFAATFAERDVDKWKVSDGHQLERFWLKQPDLVMARFSSKLPRRDDILLQGLSVELPLEFAQRANGRRIEVGILARTPRTNGNGGVSLVYATQQMGNSGWKPLPLTTEFALHSFRFDVPAVAEGYTATPIVVAHADPSGNGRAVELLGLYVKIVQ